MHCAACAISIEDALRQIPGVESVQVSAASHRGRIVWSSEQTRPSQWMQASAKAGYKAVPANDAHAHERRRREARRMVWRVAVAGLCMMQVMMYATPAYVAEAGDITPDMLQLLRWASWVLSLPVMLFSCTPFFAAAWSDLRHRRIGMDLPVAIGMLGTFVVSSLGTFEPEGPFGAEVYFDSLTMFVFFLLGGRFVEMPEVAPGAADQVEIARDVEVVAGAHRAPTQLLFDDLQALVDLLLRHGLALAAPPGPEGEVDQQQREGNGK